MTNFSPPKEIPYQKNTGHFLKTMPGSPGALHHRRHLPDRVARRGLSLLRSAVAVPPFRGGRAGAGSADHQLSLASEETWQMGMGGQ